MAINLAQVQAFIEVARSGSFAEASARLSVPRSTMSARVRTLEERLNVRLLHRTTREVSLTDEGQRYLDRCQGVIEQLEAAEADLTDPHLSGVIRMTIPIDIPTRWLAKALGEFADLHPAVRVEVNVTDEIVDLVRNNIDIALRGGAPGALSVVAKKLGQSKMALFASPAYLAAHPYEGMAGGPFRHTLLDPARRCRDTENNETGIMTRNFALAKRLAILSRAIALLPESYCRDAVNAGSLVKLLPAPSFQLLPLYLVMPSRRFVPPRTRALVDFFSDPARISEIL